uniref:Uncharacterized protein n=1 Tax=Sparus aurata TaxID=8175 RepID=A0A671W7K9_SPAAU
MQNNFYITSPLHHIQKHWHSHADTTHILWLASSHTHCSVMKHLLTYFMRAGLSFLRNRRPFNCSRTVKPGDRQSEAEEP